MHSVASPSIRPQRVGSEIRRILADRFTRKCPVALPGLVTINRVQVTAGCQHATVFVSAYGSASQCQAVFHLLAEHTGNLRHELTKSLRMRRVPQLVFVQDDCVAKTQNLCKLIDDLPEKEPFAHAYGDNNKQQ